MFTVLDNEFDNYLELKHRVSNDVITEEYIRYFDNDGFELSYLEQEYYRENKVPINRILNHAGDQRPWITGFHEKFKIDHSMILQRWEFVGEAKQQLEVKKALWPQLNKYLKVQSKWGLDFSLEYYNGDEALEVLHIELDYKDYNQACNAKKFFEEKIAKTDWEHFVQSLIVNRSKWVDLQGMEQNDWKAVHWGLSKAEKTLKAFL
jgi:hypothetical protein